MELGYFTMPSHPPERPLKDGHEWDLQVIRWLDDLFGYPAGSGGILTSGGSMANLSAIVTARRALLGEDFQGGTLYLSAQTHASVAKAAVLAGRQTSLYR